MNNINNVPAFNGVQEQNKLAGLFKQSPASVWRFVNANGIDYPVTAEDLNSDVFQQALKKAKDKEIFEGGKAAYDNAVEFIKKKFNISS